MGSEWHPIFLATEVRPGYWEMKHPTDYGPFGTIELRRVGDELRYKVMLGNDLLGWSTSLQVSAERLYVAWLERREADRRAGAFRPRD